ncbi:MAG TPA: hypothetical protein VJ302_37500 [Blastocatellia bacterium]|nr:hypothetical protein [Blastocatellia bacterium]
MYTPVVTENYRVVKKGQQFETLDEARGAVKNLSLEGGQMPAIIDDQNMVVWKGGIVPKEKESRRKAAKVG